MARSLNASVRLLPQTACPFHAQCPTGLRRESTSSSSEPMTFPEAAGWAAYHDHVYPPGKLKIRPHICQCVQQWWAGPGLLDATLKVIRTFRSGGVSCQLGSRLEQTYRCRLDHHQRGCMPRTGRSKGGGVRNGGQFSRSVSAQRCRQTGGSNQAVRIRFPAGRGRDERPILRTNLPLTPPISINQPPTTLLAAWSIPLDTIDEFRVDSMPPLPRREA